MSAKLLMVNTPSKYDSEAGCVNVIGPCCIPGYGSRHRGQTVWWMRASSDCWMSCKSAIFVISSVYQIHRCPMFGLSTSGGFSRNPRPEDCPHELALRPLDHLISLLIPDLKIKFGNLPTELRKRWNADN